MITAFLHFMLNSYKENWTGFLKIYLLPLYFQIRHIFLGLKSNCKQAKLKTRQKTISVLIHVQVTALEDIPAGCVFIKQAWVSSDVIIHTATLHVSLHQKRC